MYLRATQYVSGYAHNDETERGNYSRILQAIGLPSDICPHTPSLTIAVTVAYWRKSNAIHKWFVDHCQDGVDDCRDAYVSREQLIELRDLCKTVLADPKLAEDELPPQSGFFFGSTGIDEWYLADLKRTVEELTRILDDERLKGFDFEYHSSW